MNIAMFYYEILNKTISMQNSWSLRYLLSSEDSTCLCNLRLWHSDICYLLKIHVSVLWYNNNITLFGISKHIKYNKDTQDNFVARILARLNELFTPINSHHVVYHLIKTLFVKSSHPPGHWDKTDQSKMSNLCSSPPCDKVTISVSIIQSVIILTPNATYTQL